MAIAGTIYTIFKPRIFVADLTAKLPKMRLPVGGDWTDVTLGDPKWKRIPHTEEGASITPSAPKDDIPSDEAGGSIGVVPAGGSEITIGFTPITPDLDLFTWLSSMSRQDVAAVTGTESSPAYSRLSLSAEGRQFMIGIEGYVEPGALLANGGFVRAFGYRVEQTGDVDINMRRTGADAVLRLNAEVRCLTTALPSTQKNGIGVIDDRFDIFVVENATP